MLMCDDIDRQPSVSDHGLRDCCLIACSDGGGRHGGQTSAKG
jgi:hypothetical protein